jgi:hypothetical protein
MRTVVDNSFIAWTSTKPGDRAFRRPFSRAPSPDGSDDSDCRR